MSDVLGKFLKIFVNCKEICVSFEKNLINLVKEYCYVRETFMKVLKNVCKFWRRFVQFENNSRKF